MANKQGGNGASGSNMSTVFATWSYILPSLNYIMRDPIETPDGRAPTLPIAQHSGIYTVVYNFATASRTGIAGVPGFGMSGATGMREGFDPETEASMDKFERVRAMIGYELYSLLDDYFRDLAREIRMNAPLPTPTASACVKAAEAKSLAKKNKAKGKAAVAATASAPAGDELPLVTYYVKAYTRFSTGAAQINRIFAYLNRHFIMRAIDEGCGWISLADVVSSSVLKDLASLSISSSSNKLTKRDKTASTAALPSVKKSKEDLKKLDARKHSEWRKWGYDASVTRDTSEEIKLGEQQRKIAELCVEAASTPERIITCRALAMRSWRLEVVEPLLDPAFWNTNGQVDAWIGSAPIPPTPLAVAEAKRQELASAHDKENGEPGTITHRSISVPIILPPISGSDVVKDESKGKGKAKEKSGTVFADMALSIPVQVPLVPSPTGSKISTGHSSSGRTSPMDGDVSNGNAGKTGNAGISESRRDTHSPTPTAPSTRGNKRLVSRKGASSANGGGTTLAAVRAATAAAAAARAAEEAGQVGGVALDPALAQKGRLTRAIGYILDTPLSASGAEDAAVASLMSSLPAKVRLASTLADSLMMCGISPDKAVRRKLDRFLSKAEADGLEVIRAQA